MDLALAVGVFADYPHQFSRRFCVQRAGGAAGRVGYGVTAFLKVEATATLTTGVGEEMCFFPAAPAPPDGGTFARPVYDDEILGQTLFATNIGLLFEPLSSMVVSPRVRAGVGRLWDKKIGNWFYGAGLSFRLGSNAIVVEVERWNLGFDLRREILIFRASGPDELQSFEIIRQSPKPYFISLGWEHRIR